MLTYPIDNCPFQLAFFRGRVALYAILRGLSIAKGDEIAMQAFTCLAVPEAIMATGAKPLYIDVEENGVNMCPEDLKRKLSAKTKALVVQHTYGIPARMDYITEIARLNGVPIIEDCCHTFDSKFKGRRVGTFGCAAFYSFEWGKPVIIGIGGAAAVNDEALENKLNSLYKEFREPDQMRVWRLRIQRYGFSLIYRPKLYWSVRSLFHAFSRLGMAEGNYNPVGEDGFSGDFCLRMSQYHRNLLTKNLSQLPRYNARRKEIGMHYQNSISSSEVEHVTVSGNASVLYARFPLIAINKARLLQEAKKQKIELSDWYATPIHPLEGLELGKVLYENESCPNAEALCKKIVTLPVHNKVSRSYLERTIRFLNQL